ncbi:tyrosine-type recombinase/integrase [Nonomuraea typhae]|uniref:tyrosine-type recombinase/integrase n=1 Tax=Nonomuraea typhae TaxID=2603600 RepID=UPI0012FBDE19|nr:tyrosine-type recombinase/integrase [Nonomuraea typhae]
MGEPVVYKRCGCSDHDRACPDLADEGHGSWYFAIQVLGPSGRRERVRRGGFRTAEHAMRAARELAAADDPGGVSAACTVAQWLRHWLATLQFVRERTRQGYADHVRIHLVPGLGRIPIAELGPVDLRRFFAGLTQRRNRYGKALSPSTVQRVHATLRVALNEAIREGLIDTNPARRLGLPRTRRPHAQVWTRSRVAVWQATGQRPAVAVWTTEHLTAFLDYVREDALHTLWWLAALRGLRRGELVGLRWVDIGLETRELTVVQQLIHVNGRLQVVPPKSEASQRTIALDTETTRLLRRHQQRQHQKGLDVAGWVFTREDGQPIRPDYLTYRFRYLVAASGLPPVRLHDLRHGAASTALAAHVDPCTVQGQLGHASIVLTSDTYTSVLPELHHEAAEATARLVMSTARRAGHRLRKRTIRLRRRRTTRPPR